MSGNPIDEQDERAAVEAAAKRARQLQRKQDQEDVKALLESEAARRVLWRFLQDSGQGRSVYRDTAHAMAHAAGWQDAANWWLNAAPNAARTTYAFAGIAVGLVLSWVWRASLRRHCRRSFSARPTRRKHWPRHMAPSP